MCQETLDLERSNGGERTDSKCRKDEDHDLWYGPRIPAEFRRVSISHLSYWSGQQQHLLQQLQALGAQEMLLAQAFGKGHWYQMYMVPGNCMPFGWQTTEESPSRIWQAVGGSFLLLSRRHALSSWWLWTFNHNVKTAWKKFKKLLPVLSSRHLSFRACGCMYSSCVQKIMLNASETRPLTKPDLQCLQQNNGAMMRDLLMSSHKTLSLPDLMSYLRSLALRIWTSFWRRECSTGMDMWNAAVVHLRQPLTYRLIESVGLGGPRWLGNCWQRRIAESGSSHDRHTGRADMRSAILSAASFLEGDVDVALNLHVNQKSDDPMIIHLSSSSTWFRTCKDVRKAMLWRALWIQHLYHLCQSCWSSSSSLDFWLMCRYRGTSTSVGPLTGSYLVVCRADLIPDLQVCLSWGSIADIFHSLQSLSVSCCLSSPCLPSTCMSKAVLTAPLERSIWPYQLSHLSFRMSSRSSMPSCASSSLDLVVTMSCSLTLQVCLIIALSFCCRHRRFGFVISQVSLAWSIALHTQELFMGVTCLEREMAGRKN